MKYLNRFLAGAGLGLLVTAGIWLILEYTELSGFERLLGCFWILVGSIAFTTYHDSEGK